MKKYLRTTPILFALIGIFLLSSAVYALVYTATIVVTSTADYVMAPAMVSSNNSLLASGGYISATGLDTRVLEGTTAVPHMLADNKTLFADDIITGDNTFTFQTGQTTLSDYYIIPGLDGYITTNDDASLELGRVFEVSISGYFDTSAGANKNILYKQAACSVNVSSAGNITFHALNADDTDNWTMTSAMASGVHTLEVTADGIVAHLLIDSVEVDNYDIGDVIGNNAIVASATAGVGYVENRRNFYSQGLFWYFAYDDGDYGWNAMYSNNESWVGWTGGLGSAMYGGSDSTFITDNGTNVFYLILHAANIPRFRMGTLNADGTITWAAAEQNIVDGADTAIYARYMEVDVNNYPYVVNEAWNGVKVFKSSTNNGTWTTAAGYPASLTGNGVNASGIVRMSSGRMYVWIAGDGGNNVKGSYYNGGAWGALENINATALYYSISMVADDADCLWMVGQRVGTNNTYDIYKKPLGGAWALVQSDIWAFDDADHGYGSMTFNRLTDTLYIFWSKTVDDIGMDRGVYYKTYNTVTNTLSTLHTYYVGTTVSTRVLSPAYWDGISGGIAVQYNSTTNTNYGGAVFFPWAWPDNANDYYWMQNNVMPYADNMTVQVLGVDQLDYDPVGIILTTVLPDNTGNGNTGEFHWGTGLTGTMGSLTGGGSGGGTGSGGDSGTIPNLDRPDGLPDLNPDMNQTSTAPTNALSPLFEFWADMWVVPDNIGWILFAMLVVISSFIGIYAYFRHLGAALAMSSVFLGLFSLPTIAVLPEAGLVIGIIGLISGVVVETKA